MSSPLDAALQVQVLLDGQALECAHHEEAEMKQQWQRMLYRTREYLLRN